MKINNKTYWCVGLPVILLVFSGSWISGCGTGAEDVECPNISATADDFQKYEPVDWVWRVCNESIDYPMEEIDFYGNELDINTIAPCECTTYFSSENALIGVDYKINDERFTPVYLDNYVAVRGLTDSTEIRETPGRYTYYFLYELSDSPESNNASINIEIERSAYHENQQEK
ncbi:MAG: hypothetical protein WD016_05480 [Balneolaceae bacterium]